MNAVGASVATTPSRRKGKRPSDVLRPLTSAIKDRKTAVYDIESKGNSYRLCPHCHTRNDVLPAAGAECSACHTSIIFCPIIDDQGKGFSRAFMVSFYDGEIFRTFRNLPECMDKPWQERAIADGGCVDQFLRFLFEDRHDASAVEGLRGSTKKYQSKRFNIYAHNGGKFDHEFVLAWLIRNRHLWEMDQETVCLADELTEDEIDELEKEYGFEISAVQSKIQRLDIWPRGRKKEQGYWSFLDSISLLPMSLKKAAEQFNAPQFQKMKFDLDLPEEDPSWEEYNKYDCQALYHALVKFGELVTNDLGGEVGMTAAATSMKLYRRKYQNQTFLRNSHFSDCMTGCMLERDGEHGCEQRGVCDGYCHGCAHRWIHSGYFGGRTELFSPYGCPINYFDINSSYAASMLEAMPVGRMIELHGPKQFSRYSESENPRYIGFIECTVYIPDSCHIPPLPWREPQTGKTLFPACAGRNSDQTITGVWSWEELKLLLDPLVGGVITTIYKQVWYESYPVFRDMMMDLFAIREKYGKSSPLGYLAKLLGNSLYGKFAMREERSKLVVLDLEEQFRPGMVPVNGDFERDFLWDEETIAHANYIIPQISAHITALARVRLFRAMVDVLRAGGLIYYCDTDSILSSILLPADSQTGQSRIGERLGEWKQEDPGIFMEGEFILPKLYRLRSKNKVPFEKEHTEECMQRQKEGDEAAKKCKGCALEKFRMKGVGAPTPEKWDVMVNQRGEIGFPRVMQHRTLMKKDFMSPVEVIQTKSIRTTYDKRILEGNTSRPLLMGVDLFAS